VNVTVASATYDSAEVGTNKTITVTYSISGADADNYIAPADSTISGTITAQTRLSFDFTTNTDGIWDNNPLVGTAPTALNVTTAYNATQTALAVTLGLRESSTNRTGLLLLTFQLPSGTTLSDYKSITLTIAATSPGDAANKNSFSAEVAPASGTWGGIGSGTTVNTRLGTTTGGGLGGNNTFNPRTILLSSLTNTEGTPGALSGAVTIGFGISETVNSAPSTWLIRNVTLNP